MRNINQLYTEMYTALKPVNKWAKDYDKSLSVRNGSVCTLNDELHYREGGLDHVLPQTLDILFSGEGALGDAYYAPRIINNEHFCVAFYCPEVFYHIAKNARVLSPGPAHTYCKSWTLQYAELSSIIFTPIKKNSAPNICVIPSDLAKRVIEDMDSNSIISREIYIDDKLEAYADGSDGSDWILPVGMDTFQLNDLLKAEYDTPIKKAHTDTTPRPYMHELLKNKGTVQERYETLCKALRSLDSELPDKLELMLSKIW